MRTRILVRQKGRKITINERITKAIDIELISVYKNFFTQAFQNALLVSNTAVFICLFKKSFKQYAKTSIKNNTKKIYTTHASSRLRLLIFL